MESKVSLPRYVEDLVREHVEELGNLAGGIPSEIVLYGAGVPLEDKRGYRDLLIDALGSSVDVSIDSTGSAGQYSIDLGPYFLTQGYVFRTKRD